MTVTHSLTISADQAVIKKWLSQQYMQLLQAFKLTVAVQGKLLAPAGSAVKAVRQGHMGGPHAAGHELGSSIAYGPWPGHCVLACY